MTQVLCDENTFYFIIKNFLLSGPIIGENNHERFASHVIQDQKNANRGGGASFLQGRLTHTNGGFFLIISRSFLKIYEGNLEN